MNWLLDTYFKDNKHKVPYYFVTVLSTLLIFLVIESVFEMFLLYYGQATQREVGFGPFSSEHFRSVWVAGIFSVIAGFTFLLSTRVKAYQSEKGRIAMFVLLIAVVSSQLLLWGVGVIVEYFLPFVGNNAIQAFEVAGIKVDLEQQTVNPMKTVLPLHPNEFIVNVFSFLACTFILYEITRALFRAWGTIQRSFLEIRMERQVAAKLWQNRNRYKGKLCT